MGFMGNLLEELFRLHRADVAALPGNFQSVLFPEHAHDCGLGALGAWCFNYLFHGQPPCLLKELTISNQTG